MTRMLTTAAAIALLAAPASAAMLSDTIGADYDYDTFNTAFTGTGYYDALDTDDDALLSQSEYATGLYADYDRDNDQLLTEDEFVAGTERYLTFDVEVVFADYDANADGFLDTTEFSPFYSTVYTPYYERIDTDADGFLSADEYSTSLYGAADHDANLRVSIEEEGFFEGWFDGDDIEVEVERVGTFYN